MGSASKQNLGLQEQFQRGLQQCASQTMRSFNSSYNRTGPGGVVPRLHTQTNFFLGGPILQGVASESDLGSAAATPMMAAAPSDNEIHKSYSRLQAYK